MAGPPMTTSTETYHVLPTTDGWEVLCHEQHIARFATREAAMACAREHSGHDPGARVVIHSWSYDLEQQIPLGDEPGERGRVPWSVR